MYGFLGELNSFWQAADSECRDSRQLFVEILCRSEIRLSRTSVPPLGVGSDGRQRQATMHTRPWRAIDGFSIAPGAAPGAQGSHREVLPAFEALKPSMKHWSLALKLKL